MKLLEKNVTLGEMKFKVAVNRDIAIKSFEEFPELIEYIISQENSGATDEQSVFMNALRGKKLKALYDMEENLAKLIEFALPLMLETAGDTSDAMAIIEYAKENDADSILNSAMLEFLMQGFSQRGLAEPKIKFSMK